MLRRLVRYKIYFDRARMYYSYVTFFLLIFLTIKDTKLGDWVFSHLLISVPAGVFLVFGVALVIGFFDKRVIRPLEMEENTNINPVM